MEERVRFELTPQGFAVLYINRFATVPWHRWKESNPRQGVWRPLCYHYTTPIMFTILYAIAAFAYSIVNKWSRLVESNYRNLFHKQAFYH